MHALWLDCRGAEKDLVIAALWEAGTLGVTEHELPGSRWRLEAFFDAEFDAAAFAAWWPRWQAAAATDWVEVWRRGWEPFAVGERWWVSPDWAVGEAPEGRLRLAVQAGMASGTGFSVPTQLALCLMERHVRRGEAVLDAGTGSGILLQAALLLGARRVIGCDIDEAAAREAREAAGGLIYVGSPRSLRAGVADVAVANLNAATLRMLAGELVRVMRPRGLLLLSGFRAKRADEVRGMFTGCEPVEAVERDGWCALALKCQTTYGLR